MTRAQRDERGAVTVFVLVLSVALILAAGLVIDGGAILAARREAIAAAQGALRAGGYHGAVSVTGTRVSVTVHINQPLYVLGLAGLSSKTVTGASTARAVRGVTGPDQ